MKISYSWIDGVLSRLSSRDRIPETWETMSPNRLADLPPVHERADSLRSHR
jgi:hypothetical protein